MLVAQSSLTLCYLLNCSPSDSSVHGISRQENWSGLPFPSPGYLPNPGIESRSPALQADSLHSEPPGKPMNTGVGSLCLLHGIFPTQELNWGLLHCKQILYQLSYQGRPCVSSCVLICLLTSILSKATLQPLQQSKWLLQRFSDVQTLKYSLCSPLWGLPDSSAGKESTCNVGDPSSIPGSGRTPGEGIGYPLQYSGLPLCLSW